MTPRRILIVENHAAAAVQLAYLIAACIKCEILLAQGGDEVTEVLDCDTSNGKKVDAVIFGDLDKNETAQLVNTLHQDNPKRKIILIIPDAQANSRLPSSVDALLPKETCTGDGFRKVFSKIGLI